MRTIAWRDSFFFAAFFLTAGSWITTSSCLPQQDLAAYSAGAEVSGSALEPDELGTPAPETVEPETVAPEEVAGSPAQGSPEPSAGPSDTPANTDGPVQPEQLAPAEPTPGSEGSAGAEPAEPAQPMAEPPSEGEPPPAVDTPSNPDPAVQGPAGQFRFVRLVADSGFNGGTLMAAAELDILGADGQALDRSGGVATADSAEPTFLGGMPPALAIDGQAASVWHTAWFQLAAPPPHPHFLQLDMLEPRTVSGFRYLARQDISVGRIADYRFFVSNDGVTWGEPLLSGRLQDTAAPQEVRVGSP